MKFILNRVTEYLSVISETMRSNKYPLTEIYFCEGKEKPTSWEKYDGNGWGGFDKWMWFKTVFKMPDMYEGKPVVLNVTTGGEGQWNAINPQFIIRVNGRIEQAFDTNHTYLFLTEKATAGEEFEVIYQAYSGRKTDLMKFVPSLFEHNYDAWRLWFNLDTAMRAADMYPAGNDYRVDIENYLNTTLNFLDLRQPMSKEYFESVNAANEYIEEEFYNKFCGGKSPVAGCVGHAHIDIAWQWTVEQAREKAIRTFASTLKMMERYPEFKFIASQPQLYKFVKEDEPELYERIKERVREGRWEVEGGMWLEPDCNLASGESLIRQLLHGKRFIKEEFGKDSRILWLPDVFGYSAAMPQILNKSGIDTFVTAKIGWSEYNEFPYQTFTWQGIDGSEIFTQFIQGKTVGCKLGDLDDHYTTYSGQLWPRALACSWEHYKQKHLNNELLICYGYGDGGGGVTEDILERQRRTEKGIPGMPRTELLTAAEVIEKIKKNVEGKKLPRWVGELYLELHRATYTSMAKNKRYNRISEFLLQKTETLSLVDKLLMGGNYPKESLNKDWETVLLNQFHDILPGSSIKDVYDVTDGEYEEVIARNNEISDAVLEKIAENVSEKGVLVYNSTGFTQSGTVEFDGRTLYAENVPAYGWKVIEESKEQSNSLCATTSHLENKFFAIDIDDCGNLSRIYDKINEREVLKSGERGNVLQAFDDHPKSFDNWEITNYYSEKMWEINDVQSIEVAENTPVKASVRITRKFLNSTICQTITIYKDVARIDFDNDIDWHEHHIFVKTAFPVDVLADKASFEIQYGAVERPTHYNTSWDFARFETCAHKWADLSETGYGVALLNDCKYGYDIHEGTMKLSLIKCGTFPNPEADIGKHTFRYSLMPHVGGWRDAGVVKEAFLVNCPLKAFEAKGKGKLPVNYSFAASNAENVVVSSIKEACDNEDIILRVYESSGKRTDAEIEFGFDVKEVYDSDFIETSEYCKLDNKKCAVKLTMKPFEIKTLRIKL